MFVTRDQVYDVMSDLDSERSDLPLAKALDLRRPSERKELNFSSKGPSWLHSAYVGFPFPEVVDP